MNITENLINNENLIKKIEKQSNVKINDCYQCGKCTGGCPVASFMEHSPRQIMRLLQLGMVDDALNSNSIWLCAACHTCSSRCPKEIELSKIMDSLKFISKSQGYKAKEKDVALFHDVFLESINNNGRLHEVELILKNNLKSLKPLKDAEKGPGMFMQGKIKILPHKLKGSSEIKKIFEIAKEEK